jgi:uncharacterized protein
MDSRVEIDHDRVAAFCRRNPILRLAFFGSALRHDFGPPSDVDVLVEFAPEAHVTLIDMARMQDELSNMLGHRVDLPTKGFLSRYFRDEVVAGTPFDIVDLGGGRHEADLRALRPHERPRDARYSVNRLP